MSFARVLIQECKPGSVEMLTRLAAETFVPKARELPGFIRYQVVKVDDRTLIVVAEFETRAGVAALEQLGAEWRSAHDEVVSVRPYFGELIYDSQAAAQDAWQPSL